MKSPTLLRPGIAAVILVCAIVVGAFSAEYKKGRKVWSKRHETSLLTAPKPLAKSAAKVEFASRLVILEVKGAWLRVEADDSEGWVFHGNVASKKPKHAPAAGLTTLEASETDTVAAARPLTPVAEEFAERHNAGAVKEDLDWLDAEAADVSDLEIIEYMSENKKGEFQE